MDKYEFRRQALQRLVDGMGRGGIARVAKAINKEPNYVSRMLYESGKPGRKRIGEDSVDVLNEKFPGWCEDGGRVIADVREPGDTAEPNERNTWPFTIPFERYQRLDKGKKKQLDSRVTEFIEGALPLERIKRKSSSAA